MRKIFFTLVLTLTALTAYAQRTPHAFGVHLGGTTVDLEYQYHFNNRNFLDVTAGVFDYGDAFSVQVIYDWNLKSWSTWTPRFATWKLWGGIGGGVGIYDGGALFGPVGTIGFGFTPKEVPLTVGVDYRPMLAFVADDGLDVIKAGFRNIGLTVTYRF